MKHSKTMDRTKITLAGLALAAVLFLAVNIFSNAAFNSLRLDLTEDKLYSISEGTRKVLSALEEPVTARLYFSKNLGERSPLHAAYFTRLRELLEQYRDISGGMLRLELANPEPFSDAEDRAVAYGLKGAPINSVGDLGYFGLAVTNSTDGLGIIPFFNREREQFIEYDLTKLIHTLANPQKKVVGLLSSLPIDGAKDKEGRQRSASWLVMDQIREFFDVVTVEPKGGVIPPGVDILMIVHPKNIDEKTLYAIDQFVLGGGRALIFVDPNAEIEIMGGSQMVVSAGPSDFDKMLKGWGVALVKDKVAGDLDAARRVNAGRQGKIVVADYVAWLNLDSSNFNKNDVTTAEIKALNMATAGILEKAEGAATEMTPIVATGGRSMKINAMDVRFSPDVIALFRDFQPQGKPLTLAARLKGKAKSVFPDGPPKKKKNGEDGEKNPQKTEDAGDNHLSESAAPINVIVVSDADMLHDRFWVQASDFLGQQVYLPYANNADFVVNALDNLGGSDALIGLRARRRTERPFHYVESIRIEAERKYRAKEKLLLGKLKDVQAKMNQLQEKADKSGEAVLSAEDREAMDNSRMELVSIRKELRDVQHALREDIDRLDTWVKFLNIAALPLLLGVAALVLMGFRRSRRSRAAATGGGVA